MAAPATPLQHVFEIRIRGTLAAVWEELTRRSGVQRWIFDCTLDSELQPGSPLNWKSRNGKNTLVRGRILEIQAPGGGRPCRLVHTFQFTHLPDAPSRVTWELEQVGEEVRVTLLHDDFAGETQTYRMVKGGWASILQNLQRVMETGDIAFSTKVSYFMMNLLRPVMKTKAPPEAKSVM